MAELHALQQPMRFPIPPIRLEVGEPVPEFAWVDAQGNPYSLYTDSHCGRPTVLIVCRRVADAMAPVARFRDLGAAFREVAAQVLVVTGAPAQENANLTLMMGLPMPVLSDASFAVGAAAGLGLDAGCRVLVLSPNMRVELALDPAAGGDAAATALEHLRAKRAALPPQVVVSHPPVLVLPNVLPPQLCARIIALFERSNRYTGGITDGAASYIVVPTKVREDAMCADDGPEGQAIFALFRRRVFPEMYKAFKFRVTHVETMRIGCYDSANSGRFLPHRDENVPKMKHRRFGFTINLNAGEYEGGYLTFPEYGPQLYMPETGSIVVFSASLLHEAMPVTKGKRYGIFGFFFNEEDEAWRYATNPAFQSTVVDHPDGTYHVGRGSQPLPDPASVL
jgi:predicted 2-oxoglutarate/Fe(II)-dependent dioxygenase YbiX/peroxiredoxin